MLAMSKNRQTRLTETVNYLRGFDVELANQVSQILQGAGDVVRNQVSDQISTSGHGPGTDEGRANNTGTQRDALRALLLCQRIYMTSLWSNRLGPQPFVPNNGVWPQVSFNYWRNKSEMDIRDGLRMYVRMSSRSKEVLARAAALRNPNDDSYYTARRSSGTPPVGNSCFDQVSHWLLHAGYVSLRWIMKYKPVGFDYTPFGAGTVWISKSAAIPQTPFQIEKGMIIRMYTERRIGGHFMISAGNGFAWGYNNAALDADPTGAEGAVPNGHARCLIHRQFAEYREDTDRISAQDLGGILVLLDPAGLNNPC